jgi:hypothetical protein
MAWSSLWSRLKGGAGVDAGQFRAHVNREREEEAYADTLVREIHEAHRDWINAHRHFEYAQGRDQVDYAIYAIEAAEKRYEMLLRHAKTLKVTWTSERMGDVG